MLSRPFVLPLLVVLAACTPLGAQQAPRLRLKPASATHPEEFFGISRVRELADGRVIALDSAERKLYLVDFKTGTAPQLGRVGDGPEEYRSPRGLHPLPGDSTLVTDAQTRRLIIFHQVRPVATIPADAPVTKRGGFIYGAGAGGYLVRGFSPTDLGRAPDQGDSLYLARYARRDGRGDTLTRMRSGRGGPPGSATKATPTSGFEDAPPTRRVSMMSPTIEDQAIGFVDGWIAVVRVEPYRVDWITPAGQVTRGAPISVPPTPLTDKEKRFYLARVAAIDGLPAGPPDAITDWKAAIPPFWGGYDASLRQTPEGHVLIARTPTAALPTPTYDLVDRNSRYRGQLVLSASEAVVGFGARSIYVVARSPDGTEQLRRHPWP